MRRFPVIRDSSGYVRGYVQYLSFDLPLFVRLLALPRGTVLLCEPPPTTGIVMRAACAIRGFPYAYFAADLWSEALAGSGQPAVVRAAVRWMERTAIRGADVVLSVSAEVADRIAGFSDGEVVVVGNGIDTELFRPEDVPSTPRGQGAPLLVYTGTASEVHGAGIFVEAMRMIRERHPRAQLVFMGHGADIPAMRAAAADLPEGAVVFLPVQPAEVVAKWLNRADVAVASVRPGNYGFAFPTKVYAAAACGTPVVLAGEGPAAEAVRAGRLGRAADYDPEAVADAVDAQLADSAWDGAAARAWVEQNGSLKMVGENVAERMRGMLEADAVRSTGA